jgi:hypothetical protein
MAAQKNARTCRAKHGALPLPLDAVTRGIEIEMPRMCDGNRTSRWQRQRATGGCC